MIEDDDGKMGDYIPGDPRWSYISHLGLATLPRRWNQPDMTPDQYDDLIARLEAADGPDRELDAVICASMRYADNRDVPMGDWRWLNFPAWEADKHWVRAICDDGSVGASWTSEPLTGSMDAAIAFHEAVLPGAKRTHITGGTFDVTVHGLYGEFVCHGSHKSEPIALIIATLRAMKEKKNQNDR